MSSLLARLYRLEKAITPKDGDVQVISALMDELAGNAPSGAYEKAIERLSLRRHSFPQSSELRALLVGGGKRKDIARSALGFALLALPHGYLTKVNFEVSQMNSRAALLKQLKAYHQRSRERFKLWQASGYRHELKPIHEPMPEELSHIPCAAKTRAGTPCKRTDINSNGRCKYHGGHSTGALTAEGKARQLEGYRRWQQERAGSL